MVLNFSLVAPLIALAVGALVVLLFDLALPARVAVGWWYLASLGAIALSGYYTVALWPQVAAGAKVTAYGGAFIADRFSLVLNVILLLAALFTVLLSTRRTEEDMSGYLALVLWGVMGMMVMAGAGNLMAIFLGLEIFSLALYVVVSFRPQSPESKEAGFKYLILGSLGAGMLLFGSALIFGATGSLSFAGISAAVTKSGLPALGLYMKVGMGLALTGFALKLALVPFHVWSPDAYEGAPSAITAFMSVGTKAAAFAGLVRFLTAVLPAAIDPAVQARYLLPLSVLAALSMLWGGMAALRQQNMKRLLAYSGIAQAGYLFLGLTVLSNEGIGAAVFYLAAYLFFNMGAFTIIEWLSKDGQDGTNLETWHGLFYSHPGIAALASLFFFALAGMPPTAGLTGKILLALVAVKNGNWFLLTALMVSTGISAYAYLRVISVMAKKPEGVSARAGTAATAEEVAKVGERTAALPASAVTLAIGVAIALAAIGTLWLGIVPGGVIGLTRNLISFGLPL
ncbi:MAG: NADH-quinone oxidoreductase subunit N [Symbiobacteriia bacterium]